MSETASRRLFLAEMLLAVPTLAFITIFVIGGGGVGLIYFGAVTVTTILGDPGIAVFLLFPFLAAVSVWIAGLVALIIAVEVSHRFWTRGRAAHRQDRSLFVLGLLCGVAPLALLLFFGWSSRVDMHAAGVAVILFARASGLLLLPPILHLGLELRGTVTATP